MAYVDGFILPLPKNHIDEYLRMAKKTGSVWKEYGALEYRECIADDVKSGQVTSFPQSVQMKPDETVVFSYIVYRSRAHRDEVNAKVMADPRVRDMMSPTNLPFDGKRMFFGGFETLLEL